MRVRCLQLNATLPSCDFVTIDTELTGIELERSKQSILDTEEERFKKNKTVASSYAIVQCGISVFHLDRETKRLRAKSYSFYLFGPRTRYISKRFGVQSGTLQFLADNNFDFNKWAREGLSYIHQKDEDFVRQCLSKRAERDMSQRSPVEIKKPEDAAYVASVKEELQKWLESLPVEGTGEEHVLAATTGFYRLLVHRNVMPGFPMLQAEGREEKGKRLLVVKRQKRDAAEELKKINSEISEAVGFRAVFQALSKCKRPVVGHNCYFDLLFLFNSLYAPLPDCLNEWRRDVQMIFPTVVDTKHVAALEDFKLGGKPIFPISSLPELYQFFLNSSDRVPIGMQRHHSLT